MGTSRTHLNKHHVAKADAALAMAILEANQRVQRSCHGFPD
jgi:hypothetical protein